MKDHKKCASTKQTLNQTETTLDKQHSGTDRIICTSLISTSMGLIQSLRRYKQGDSANGSYTSSVGAVTLFIFRLSKVMVGCVFAMIIAATFTNHVSAVGTLSLSVSNNTVSLNVAPINATGTFAKSDNVTISASTNNSTGYTLSIAAGNSTNYDKLINSTSSGEYLTSITSATTEEQFKALNGTAYNGTWGYLPSKYNSVINTDFRPAPGTGGDILDKTAAANNTANEYTLAIGARADMSTKLGSYSNTYNVILVANEVPYTITYDDSIVSNMPTDVNSASSDSSVNISSNIPVRNGYTFLGWCTVMPTGSDDNLDQCSGTTYTAGQAWTLGASDNNLHLFAMWKAPTTFAKAYAAAGKTQTGGYYTMQDMTDGICKNVDTGQEGQVIDTRDNNVYLIGKLADNKCWLLDNLRLDLTNSTVVNTLSESNTNATNTILNYLKNGGGTTSNQYPTAGLTKSNWTSSYSYSAPLVNVSGTFDGNAYTKDSTVTSYGNGSGKIGVYYNYCAASAGSYCWGNGANASGSPTSDPNTSSLYDISADICPAGWHLPTTDTGGEYQNLYNAYSTASEGQATAFRNALSTPLSGSFFGGSAYSQGSRGYFWSSTWNNNTYTMRYLNVYSSDVNPSNYVDRLGGSSVRCVQGSL